MKRDRFRCTYCGAPGTDVELEVDHIVAVANGGSHHMSNLTTACRTCNQRKGANAAPPASRMSADQSQDDRPSAADHVLAWEPNTAMVRLFRLGKEVPREYTCTGLGAYLEVRAASFEQRKAIVFIEAYHLIVADGCDPDAVHRALWPLAEYQDGLAADFPAPGNTGNRWGPRPT